MEERLRRSLPRPAYRSLLTGYQGVRQLARQNPGRGRLLPDFVIIGAAKAGTTSVYAWLCEHPYVARASLKEIHYFSFYPYRGTDWYRQHFPLARDRGAFAAVNGRPFLTGEASPSYMIDADVPARMAKLLPDVKLIVCLRDPVERAYSQFHMRRRDGDEPLEDFLTACALEDPAIDGGAARGVVAPELAELRRTYLVRGRYADHLERWFECFSRERFHITDMQNLARDPGGVLAALYAFLELPPDPQLIAAPRFSASYTPLPERDRDRLREYFAPHNRRLYTLLGRDFGWGQ